MQLGAPLAAAAFLVVARDELADEAERDELHADDDEQNTERQERSVPDRLARQLEDSQVAEQERPDRSQREAEAAEEVQGPVPVAAHEGDRKQVEEAAHIALHPVPGATVLSRPVVDGKLRDPEAMAKLAPEHSEEWRELGVSILQKLVLGEVLKGKNAQPPIQYVHLLKEVTDAVAAKACDVAVLVPPATMDHVETIAGNRETMPAKSTYFYPKVLTGVVFNSLKKD